MAGKLIVIEGFEGAGKSTLTAMLNGILSSESVVFTREPGGTSLSEELRQILKHGDNGAKADHTTRLLMFWAARADHMNHVIVPALQEGRDVICDRFDAFTFAYQVWGPQVFHLEKLFIQLRDEVCRPEPSWYVHLDLNWRIGFQRSRGAGMLDNFASASMVENSHRENGYRIFFRRYAFDRHTRVDASRDHDVVQRDAVAAVLEALKR